MLRFLAERGGRVPFTFGKVTIVSDGLTDEEKAKLAKDADDSIRHMAEQLHVITLTPIIGQADTYEMALTDIGRNIIEQMGLTVKPQSFHFDLKTGKEKTGL